MAHGDLERNALEHGYRRLELRATAEIEALRARVSRMEGEAERLRLKLLGAEGLLQEMVLKHAAARARVRELESVLAQIQQATLATDALLFGPSE